MESVQRPVEIDEQQGGRFSVTIGGDTEIIVETNAAGVQQSMSHLWREMCESKEKLRDSEEFRSIVGLKLAPRNMFDRRPAIFQICIGSRCVLLPIINNNQPIPKELADLIDSNKCSFQKIIGMYVPDSVAPCFAGATVQCDEPWEMALRMGRTELQFLPLYGFAELLTGSGVVMPRQEDYTAEQMCMQWPPTPSWIATLCLDVYMLRQIGRSLLLEFPGKKIPELSSDAAPGCGRYSASFSESGIIKFDHDTATPGVGRYSAQIPVSLFF